LNELRTSLSETSCFHLDLDVADRDLGKLIEAPISLVFVVQVVSRSHVANLLRSSIGNGGPAGSTTVPVIEPAALLRHAIGDAPARTHQ